MACCNNKKECDNKPIAEMSMLNYSGILTALVDIAKTGKITGLFKNQEADDLAKIIAGMVDENKYLRAILGVMKPDVAVTDEEFKISFGPGKNYTLTIPVTTAGERAELISALEAAITKLKETSPPVSPLDKPKQMPLFLRD